MSAVIIGATSSIGRALALELGRRGEALVLASRDEEELARIATDAHLRTGMPVTVIPVDVTETGSHAAFVARVLEEARHEVDILVLLPGYMGDHEEAATDFQEAERTLAVNYGGVVSLLTAFLPYFEKRGRGRIVIVSSVAGDRGRQSNYVYGSAKAGLNVYAQGLRNRLHARGVRVLTVKPGFVDTPMTWGKEKVFLAASPQDIAHGICRALDRGRDIVYLPWFWRWIMFIIRSIPEWFFKRMKL